MCCKKTKSTKSQTFVNEKIQKAWKCELSLTKFYKMYEPQNKCAEKINTS
jgi:hypothetical protein